MEFKKNNILDIIHILMKDNNLEDECKNHIFEIVKFLTVFLRPNIKSIEKYNYIIIKINIYEAVISDIIENKDFMNALFGFNLTLLLPIMKYINLLDCEGLKIWAILYFLLNIKFCKNKKYSTIQSFAHNFPALHKTLISFGYTPDELLNNWYHTREVSIITSMIQGANSIII